ncbi:MAG TPA: FKBP-type peptidyl-prolyl cis-trans isomerase [Opitutus sp.]|nr:FKBP-type peptidyl-prolyl cis-trans isomerase [Opitutus sp.]
MKSKLILSACTLLAGFSAAAFAQEIKLDLPNQAGAKNAAAPAPAAEFAEEQLIEEFGWFVATRVGISELDFNAAEVQAFIKGIKAAAEGKESPYELEKIGPFMDQFMQRKQTAYLAKLKQKSETESTAFMTDLKKKQGVVVLPSGLVYEIEKQGEGPAPKAEDKVRVHYTGKLVDGTVFDSSVERGEPAEFELNQVIPGWTEGLQKISKGGKIKLYVPPQLAYGDDGRPGIPPASTLVFDVELLDINPPAAATPPASQAK